MHRAYETIVQHPSQPHTLQSIACRGRYMVRLPDGTLSWSDEYEQSLRKFLVDRDKQQNESDDGDAGVRDHPRNR